MPTDDKDQRTWAALLQVSQLAGYVLPLAGLAVPLAIWLIKKDTMPFVERQGKEVLNFQITLWIALLIAGFLCWILIGFVLLPILVLIGVIMPIVGAVRCSHGDDYRYPLIFRFVQ